MAYEVKLEVYTLRLRQQREREYISLDSILNNIDFFIFFQDYVRQFDSQLSINRQHQKSIQFRNGSLRILSQRRFISGIIDSGDYGIESSIVNIDSGVEQYHKTINDTDIKPFYFLLYIPNNADKAIVILQRLGIYGINGIFRNHLEDFIKTRYSDLVIEFSPLISRNLAQAFINDGAIKEFVIRRYNLTPDITEKLGVIEHEEDIHSIELKITAKRKKALPFNNRVRRFVDNQNAAMFDLPELESLGLAGENCKSSIKVKLGRQSRTVDLSETGQIRPYYDIDNEVQKDNSGHPEFDSINEIAINLIEDLISEIGL